MQGTCVEVQAGVVALPRLMRNGTLSYLTLGTFLNVFYLEFGVSQMQCSDSSLVEAEVPEFPERF
jgi:hypothetical protein